MYNNTSRLLFPLSFLRGVGAATISKIAELPNLHLMTTDDIANSSARIAKALSTPGAWEAATQSAENQIERAAKANASIIGLADDDYPPLLKSTPDAPSFLYVKGNLQPTIENAVAVIGTRTPTLHGDEIANRITAFLVQDGWSIVSGLAIGCDTTAHKAALSLGGHTVAVLAHGLQTIAPRQNARLADHILDTGGALVSEYPFGTEPMPHQFAQRDRIQAGLSRGVVTIQSDLGGGSIHASRAAIRYGRLLATPMPTKTDREQGDKKIELNMLLAGADNANKSAILSCRPDQLSQLMLIAGKEDYAVLSSRLRSI